MKICIFEDDGYKNLYPLTYFKPVYDLKCGIDSLKDKIFFHYNDLSFVLHTREILSKTIREKQKLPVNDFELGDYLFINGRVLFDRELKDAINLDRSETIYTCNGTEIAAVIPENFSRRLSNFVDNFSDLKNIFPEFNIVEINAKTVNYPWDLISENKSWLFKDFERFTVSSGNEENSPDNVILINKSGIRISKSAKIFPGVVLDAEDGPIFIDENAVIMPHTYIKGPVYVGFESVIKAGTRIYPGTTIGIGCKVGGEVNNSIIHAYSNKQHDGFLGHSYLGEWVNLGANTTNSNLKNNYSTVKVDVDHRQIDTGLLFLGIMMGDHGKTGINSMFNTGTIAGPFCNIFPLPPEMPRSPETRGSPGPDPA